MIFNFPYVGKTEKYSYINDIKGIYKMNGILRYGDIVKQSHFKLSSEIIELDIVALLSGTQCVACIYVDTIIQVEKCILSWATPREVIYEGGSSSHAIAET